MNAKWQSLVLAYIDKHGPASAAGLSRGLSASKTTVQYHLKRMLEEGVIETVPPPSAPRAAQGRPMVYYRRTLAHCPDDLPTLAALSLRLLLTSFPEEIVANDLAAEMADQSSPRAPFAQRMARAIDTLQAHAYAPRWEIHRQGPRIFLHNCPYRRLLPEFPTALCLFDRRLLESLTGAVAQQIARIDPGDPVSACCFQILLG